MRTPEGTFDISIASPKPITTVITAVTMQKMIERTATSQKVGLVATGPLGIGAVAPTVPAGGVVADALAALASLGFKPAEASAAVSAAEAELGPGASLDALVRLSLRKAARA